MNKQTNDDPCWCTENKYYKCEECDPECMDWEYTPVTQSQPTPSEYYKENVNARLSNLTKQTIQSISKKRS